MIIIPTVSPIATRVPLPRPTPIGIVTPNGVAVAVKLSMVPFLGAVKPTVLLPVVGPYVRILVPAVSFPMIALRLIGRAIVV
jgi:hypothetical protein